MDEVVPKHAEEQLRSKLKARALRKCDALAGVRGGRSSREPALPGRARASSKSTIFAPFPVAPQAMVECTRDRLFSVVWACREPLHALNECTHQWTNEEELARVKERWVKAGRPM